MRKIIITISVLLLVSGCRPLSMWYVTPEGPPEYQLGWQDGCDTGFSAEDEGYLYRAMYGFKKRPEMMENETYNKAWNEGFNYCRYMLDSHQK